MQLENVFFKYIPIFNWLGESRIVLSDFHLSNPSPKKRLLINMMVFTSLFLTLILSIFNATAYIKYFPEDQATPHVIFLLMYILRTNSKWSSLVQMNSWFNYFPKLYAHFKDIQRVSESRYKMDFRSFQAQFDHDATIVFIIWSAKIIIYFAKLSEMFIYCVICLNESIVLLINHIVFFHVYFYVLLFKSMVSFYIGYVERKALFDKPKTLSELRVELIFIKIINIKLHETSKVLNDAFGWMFVWIFIQKFSEIVGNVFWTYGNLNCQAIFEVIRKYNSFHSILKCSALVSEEMNSTR